jgi:MraZ protein
LNNYFNEKNLHSVDSKGRILLPKDLREHHALEKGDVLICVPSGTNPAYVEIRTKEQWERYRASLRRSEPGESKKDSFRVADLSKDTATLDGQGRLSIPQWIRDACRINDSVAVVDMDDYIEVWARENIEQKYADMLRAFKERNDKMF